nr:AAA family ATPase [uncultured Allomuricauda sp.]
MTKKLFIAATGQHKGKTTCTLGIAASIKSKGYNVGYCKPVGQNHILIDDAMVDKDVVLFENILDFQTVPKIHSPVIISSGVTRAFIDDPSQFQFVEKIQRAKTHLEKNHDVLVYEGTGHAGVGSIVDLSNAQVAKMLDCEVIMVAEGGIGNTFDQLNMNLALFRELDVPVKGVIINKIHPGKSEKVIRCVTEAMKKIDIPVLGALPYDKVLSYPLLATIKKSISGRVLLNPKQMYKQVEDIIAGSLAAVDELTHFHNLVLIATIDNLKTKIQNIKRKAEAEKLEGCPLSGVIITSYDKFKGSSSASDFDDDYLKAHKIPVLATDLDTYDTVVAISNIEVKINNKTPWKVKRAISLFENNVDLKSIY